MRRVASIILFAAVLAMGAAWPAAGGVPIHVTIDEYDFTPETKTFNVRAGPFSVGFHNDGAFDHTVTHNRGYFDSGDVASGNTVAVTLFGAGSYPYHCQNHPDLMRGTLNYKPAASDTEVGVGDSIDLLIGDPLLKGVAWDVQRRRNGGDWVLVADHTFDATPTFTFGRKGTFDFRARTVVKLGRTNWSPNRTVVVTPVA